MKWKNRVGCPTNNNGGGDSNDNEFNHTSFQRRTRQDIKRFLPFALSSRSITLNQLETITTFHPHRTRTRTPPTNSNNDNKQALTSCSSG